MGQISSTEKTIEICLRIYPEILVKYYSKNGLRINNCGERRVCKSEDISGPKGGTYMFNTSPKSSDLCLSNDVW